MTINTGIWLDHHKAVVVRITKGGDEISQIVSERDSPARISGGRRVKNSYTRNDFVPEDKRERKATIRLNKYYDEVIARLRDADAILLVGPGEAKGELIKRIVAKKVKGRISHVRTVDKMTDRQIAALVRREFGIASQRATTRAPRPVK